MQWIRFRIRTVPEAEDILISELSELGLCGAQIEDHVPLTAAEKEQIYTYDADDPEDDGIAHVSFYAAVCADGRLSLSGDPEADALERKDARALEDAIRDTLASVRSYTDIGDGTLDISVTDDAEWKDKIIYWGPMGCLTGFYLILKGSRSPREIYGLILNAFKSVEYADDVPGATAVNCGHYLMHNLAMAKFYAAEFSGYLEKNAQNRKIFEYPKSERLVTDDGKHFFDS